MTFFKQFPKFAPLPLLNFEVDLKFDHIPLCVLLKLKYAKFGVSNLFFPNVIEEKPLGGRLDPLSLGQEGLSVESSLFEAKSKVKINEIYSNC